MRAAVLPSEPASLFPISATLLDALEEWVSRIAIVICDLDPGQERSVMTATNKVLSAIELEADRGRMPEGAKTEEHARVEA